MAMKKGPKASFCDAHYASSNENVLNEAKARKSGGRVVGENHGGHAPDVRLSVGGKGVHGKPLMSSAGRKT